MELLSPLGGLFGPVCHSTLLTRKSSFPVEASRLSVAVFPPRTFPESIFTLLLQNECGGIPAAEPPLAFHAGDARKKLLRREADQHLEITLQNFTETADSSGMIVFLLVFGVNVLLTVAAFIRERGEDPRFEGDKLLYRS